MSALSAAGRFHVTRLRGTAAVLMLGAAALWSAGTRLGVAPTAGEWDEPPPVVCGDSCRSVLPSSLVKPAGISRALPIGLPNERPVSDAHAVWLDAVSGAIGTCSSMLIALGMRSAETLRAEKLSHQSVGLLDTL